MKKYLAEMIGTFVLTLMGCGAAVFAGIGLGTTGYGISTLDNQLKRSAMALLSHFLCR